MTEYDLFIFDLDDTLVPRDRGYLLEYRADVLIALARRKPAARWAIVTNQGGVGVRYWMESQGWGEPAKYPTEEQAWQRLMGICHFIEDVVRYATDERGRRLWLPKPEIVPLAAFAFCSERAQAWGPEPESVLHKDSWRHDWRKPEPGMLLRAIEITGATNPLMIGDLSEDRAAAKAAGIEFMDAGEFFGLRNWTRLVEGDE